MGTHAAPPGRDEDIYRKYVQGYTQSELAIEYNVTQPRINQIIKAQREAINAEERAELIRDSLELQRYIKREALRIAQLAGAPIAVGKDGSILYDPEDGSVVRDHAACMKALSLAGGADDTIARRLGLDAATKTESTATVHYKLDGVDIDDLR